MNSTYKIKQWLWDIFSTGLPKNYDLEVLRKIFLLNIIIVLGSIFLAFLGTLAFIQNNYILSYYDIYVASIVIEIPFVFI